MSGKPPRSLIRMICIALLILIVGALSYQNYIVYKRIKSLKRSPPEISEIAGYLPDLTDEVSIALAALVAENAIYRASLKRQRINLKECMSKLPQNEIDDFYRRHREELEQEGAK